MHLSRYYKARSERARRMANARWAKHRARPDDPEALENEVLHPHLDVIGSLEWRDFRTGEIKRWRIKRGDRVDRVILSTPDGRATKSHGWTWALDHLRGFLAGTKV